MRNDRLPRRATELVAEYLEMFRVVVLDGPGQAGKTTILRQLTSERAIRFASFDDPAELAAATADPLGYLADLGRPLAIDEFQRAGDPLLLAIKYMVDRDDTRGQYILAGSTNFLTTGQLSETLAGRAGLVRVWPFSQGERRGRRESFVEQVLDDPLGVVRRGEALPRRELAQLVATGGFPEAALAPSDRARNAFFDSYLRTVISREAVLDAGSHRDPATLRRVFDALAARTAQELNTTDLGADTGLARETVIRHVGLLVTLNQVVLLPAWASSAATRAKRRPKVVVADSGVASALLRRDPSDLADRHSREYGSLLETFVIGEILRQAAWSTRGEIAHYRDRDGREVDIIIEGANGLVGIEVKAGTAVDRRAANHLRYLADRLGPRWLGGLVLHGGDQAYEIQPRIWAVPLTSLWS